MENEIKHLATYLNTSCGKVTVQKENNIPVLCEASGKQVKGLVSIAKCLARKSDSKEILGRNAVDQAVVDQWLEYRVIQIDRCTQEKDQQNILKELNEYLLERVYLAGFYLTLADLVLYLGLYKIFSELTFYDKQQYVHVSRWFDQVQHNSGVQQGMKKIYFQRNYLYSKGASH